MVLKGNFHNILFAVLTYIQSITLRRQTSLTTNLQRNLHKKNNIFFNENVVSLVTVVYIVSHF
jgi:hypothetical protein